MTDSPPGITWINHASYLLEHGEVRLVTDPWLQGSAFNNGWTLLAPSRFEFSDFERVTHIWFSHEHPDHFSPPNLLKIPEPVRRGIRVLFRKTRDGRVATFCRKLGFHVLELEPSKPYELSPSVSVVCGVLGSDSWLLTRCGQYTVLNVNDCVFRDASQLRAVRSLGGRPDVLLTQFSYANWAGNPGDTATMRAAAAAKIVEIRVQISELQPRWVIPFASFVLFSHSENSHLNEGANLIRDVVEVIRESKTTPVVLYPGDRWDIGSEHSNDEAVSYYEADREGWRTRPLAEAPAVTLEQLQAASAGFLERMRARNWLWTLKPLQWSGALRPLAVYVSDLDITVEIQLFAPLRVLGRGQQNASLRLTADSLLFMLKNDFGVDTLLVNGRFIELEPAARHKLSRLFAVARHNNDGYSYPGRYFDLSYLRARLQNMRTRVGRV